MFEFSILEKMYLLSFSYVKSSSAEHTPPGISLIGLFLCVVYEDKTIFSLTTNKYIFGPVLMSVYCNLLLQEKACGDVVLMLLANKLDAADKREVTPGEGQRLAEVRHI